MFEENRATPRETIALVLMLEDGSLAVTQNVSASGLCLRLSLNQQLGNRVHLQVDLVSAGLSFVSEGKVVRRENKDGAARVAIKFTSARLKSAD